MNDVMSNIRFMPSPHGLSKRVRLNHDKLYPDVFKDLDQYEYSEDNKEANDDGLFKTSHTWVTDSNVTGNLFPDVVELKCDISREKSKCGDEFKKLNKIPIDVIHENEERAKVVRDVHLSTKDFILDVAPNCFKGSQLESNSSPSKLKCNSDSVSSRKNISNELYPNKDEFSNVHSTSHNMPRTKYNAAKYVENKSIDVECSKVESNGNLEQDGYLGIVKKLKEKGIEINKVQVKNPSILNDQQSNHLKLKKIASNNRGDLIPKHVDSVTKPKVTLLRKYNYCSKKSWKKCDIISSRLPDYKEYSNVIQTAMKDVRRPRFEPISPTESVVSNEMEVSNGKSNGSLNTKWQLNILQDMEELEDFLDYVNNKITEVMFCVTSISKDIKILDAEIDDISSGQNEIESFTNYENNTDRFRSTYEEMKYLGSKLKGNLVSLKAKWSVLLNEYRANLSRVSRSAYDFCSIPFETMLAKDREFVFDRVNEIELQIQDTEACEKDIDVRRANYFAEYFDLQRSIQSFHEMNNVLYDFC